MDDVESLTAINLVVVSVMPNLRNDSAICEPRIQGGLADLIEEIDQMTYRLEVMHSEGLHYCLGSEQRRFRSAHCVISGGDAGSHLPL